MNNTFTLYNKKEFLLFFSSKLTLNNYILIKITIKNSGLILFFVKIAQLLTKKSEEHILFAFLL